MKKLTIGLCLAAMVLTCAPVLAQDNPLPMGAPMGGNNRPHTYSVPYIFGDGSLVGVKWKVQLDVAPYSTRRNAWHNITFDENGGLYFRGAPNAAVTDYGIHKVDSATGQRLWYNPAVADTAFSTGSAIVGQDYVYAARYDPANPTVYALNKATGAVVWESAALPMEVGLNMALYDGVLYGTTQRDANGNNHAFAISAATGAIMHVTPYATSMDNAYYNMAFAPDVFGEGEHGMYWLHNDNGGLGEAIYGISISAASAGKVWSSTPIRAYASNVIYNPETNAVYALHWADYGTSVESYDPVTGTIRWTAAPNGDPNLGFPGGFNGGYYTTHTLKADGSGFIFGGFGHDVYSVTDPGDLGGAALTMNANGDWYFDGLDTLGESSSCAVLVMDPTTGNEVYISGTLGTDPDARRLYALDAQTGAQLWEWIPPGDPSPYGGFSFRGLSVGPDGTLYYFNADEGPQGTLYAIGVIPEPGVMALFGFGLLALLGLRRKK